MFAPGQETKKKVKSTDIGKKKHRNDGISFLMFIYSLSIFYNYSIKSNMSTGFFLMIVNRKKRQKKNMIEKIQSMKLKRIFIFPDTIINQKNHRVSYVNSLYICLSD